MANMTAAATVHHTITTLAGIQMPKLIYGTAWKKDQTADLVLEALRTGFRGIDTACQPKHYHEPGIGVALKKFLAENPSISREDIFIQTKFTSIDGQDPNSIPYDKTAPIPEQVKQSLDVSLKNLGVSYIDSLVLHGPLRTVEKTMEVWRTFESFVNDGRVKQIGVSNFYDVSVLKNLFTSAEVKPAVIQNRFYQDTDYDKEIRAFAKSNGIIYQSFWTLTANPHVLGDSKVRDMSKRYDKTPAQIFFTYLIQSGGFAPLTGTKSKVHMTQDLEALQMKLTADEMKTFDAFFN